MNAFRVWDGQHTFLFIMQHVCGLGYLAWKHVGNTLGQCWKHVGPMSETGWSNTSLLALGQRKSNEQNHVWPNVWLTRRANKRTLVGPTLAKPKIVVGGSSFWMSMRHAMPSLAITLVLSTLMSRLYLRLTRSRRSTNSSSYACEVANRMMSSA